MHRFFTQGTVCCPEKTGPTAITVTRSCRQRMGGSRKKEQNRSYTFCNMPTYSHVPFQSRRPSLTMSNLNHHIERIREDSSEYHFWCAAAVMPEVARYQGLYHDGALSLFAPGYRCNVTLFFVGCAVPHLMFYHQLMVQSPRINTLNEALEQFLSPEHLDDWQVSISFTSPVLFSF